MAKDSRQLCLKYATTTPAWKESRHFLCDNKQNSNDLLVLQGIYLQVPYVPMIYSGDTDTK